MQEGVPARRRAEPRPTRSQLRKALDQLDSGDVLMFEIAFISILFRRLKRLVSRNLAPDV
jgi:hypothetical protein